MNFQRLSVEDARQLISEKQVTLVDIRDEQSFKAAHIPDAQHIDNHSVADFLAKSDKEQPLIVCCYHGNSSQSAARFFAEHSFLEVYSLDGGFEAWQQAYPEQCTPSS